ncbi:MAG: GTP-binding protein, partial [Eubacteriales bacterium]|nr:GTP-binding protein [Eubacteriales bacterium]
DHDHCGHDHHDHHHHHADEVFSSWGLENVAAFEKKELETVLEKLANGTDFGRVLRAKGMVPGENPGEWLYFDLVPEEYEIRTGSPDYTGKVCVIGAELNEEELSKAFGRN